MTQSSIIHGAERLRGCIWAEDFTPGTIAGNKGVISGSLQYDTERGAFFDGVNDYITYGGLIKQSFNSGFVSVVIDFVPNFHPSSMVVQKSFFDNASGTRYLVAINASGTLSVILQTTVATIVVGSYQQYWKINQRNVLAITSRSTGSTSVYLNGVLIGSSVTTWTPGASGDIVVSRDRTSTFRYSGSIHSMKFFRHSSASELLTAQEAKDYYTRSTFKYADSSIFTLDMSMGSYDPAGKRVLDVSGRGNNFTLGDGVTPMTFPSKSITRGFGLDGGDYFKKLANLGTFPGSVVLLAKSTWTGNTGLIDFMTGAGGGQGYMRIVAGLFSASTGTKYINAKPATAVQPGSLLCFAVSGMTIECTQQIIIGATYSLNMLWIGSVYYVSLFSKALTPMQVAAETLKAMMNSRLQ